MDEPRSEIQQVPFEARKAIQQAIWQECIAPADNEWTTFSDSAALAEVAARALVAAGWKVDRADPSAGRPYFGEIDGEPGWYWLTPSPVEGHPPYVRDLTDDEAAALFGSRGGSNA